MAVRIRKNGTILCAAMHPPMEGDTYLDDSLHYRLSCDFKVLVTQYWDEHKERGEWWWKDQVPKDITIDEFYNTTN